MKEPRSEHLAKLVLRLSVGGLMVLHGIHKLTHGVAGIERMLASRGLPELLAYGVYAGELIAPLFILAGFKTRIAAAVFAFNMIVAVALAHADDVLTLGKHGQWGIELQALYLLGAIAVMLLGAGRYSVSRGAGRWD
mgnify:FL=1